MKTKTTRILSGNLFFTVVIFGILFFVHSEAIAQIREGNVIRGQGYTGDSLGITIHQEILFKVSPEQVYDVLLSSRQFSDCTKKSFDMFTTTSAHIDPKVGGSFSVFDGHIFGINLDLVPGKRIVQAWRVIDWPAGIYSIVRFEFQTSGSGTKLIFDHVGFPEGLKDHLTLGWQQHYWDALTKYFQ